MFVQSPQQIPELSHKRIQQFYIGGDFVLAISSATGVYSWGHNNCGQLARCVTPEGQYSKPQKITYLDNKNIVTACCGLQHSLALTTDGHVYAWGSNNWGQIGCGKYTNNLR
ncbi:unnamed protein product [Oppiella nova]|uniref:Uncharacterized protein n=1 Tax=Oppiella nova TaxID=334625 RepID=A0A7R9QK06_9ACAR|nr:unnamed protein product [Oppiella nova]CAG2167469.1 unnamed protein product [Oppiella nova]